jgi:integrase
MTKRDYKTGGLRERSPNAWELKVRTFDPRTGKRIIRYESFKGTKLAAKKRLAELANQASDGIVPDEKALFGSLLDRWEETLDVSPKTAERYKELIRLHVRPHLGDEKARSITTAKIESVYSRLRSGVRPDGTSGARPLSPRTIGHIHRRVVQVLALAERDKIIPSNPARLAKRPKIIKVEVEILDQTQVSDVLKMLRGRAMWLLALTGLATGLRRGELLGLRWKDVDFDSGTIQVVQSLEQTKAKGLRLKAPKTKQGRRQLSVPSSVITELRGHKSKQSEERLALGLGRDPEDGLVFRHPDGSPLRPDNVSGEWRRLVGTLKLPKVSLHAWRHTHASQLISAGMDVLTISRRLGHASPSITLDVYGHLFAPTDKEAAAVFERAFGASIPGNNSEQTRTK